jgi:AAA domain-containing protein
MTFQFKPAIREAAGLLIGLAGGTGSGKTFTGMRLASGISGGKAFAVIDTEAGRALHYADQFKFDHGDLKPPFTPQAYAEAILAADAAGYPVIMVDSTTHEWAGEGGVLEMHDAELDRMAGDDYAKRERVKMAAWIKPKMDHKKMVQRLLQVRAHLILCFRAEEKVEMIKDDKGKTVIVPKTSLTGINGWIPVCEKNLPFELTASFLLTADAPGMPKPIKLEAQHKPMFPLDKPIDEESGRKVAAWASGGKIANEYVSMAITEFSVLSSLDTLKTAFGRAYTRAKKSGDVSDMTMLQNAYDKAKDALTAPREAAISEQDEPTI